MNGERGLVPSNFVEQIAEDEAILKESGKTGIVLIFFKSASRRTIYKLGGLYLLFVFTTSHTLKTIDLKNNHNTEREYKNIRPPPPIYRIFAATIVLCCIFG